MTIGFGLAEKSRKVIWYLLTCTYFCMSVELLAVGVVVPGKMTYCDLKLTFTPEGRAAIQKQVDQISRNYLSIQTLVERANVYMPFIEDAFKQIGAPLDLKYIVIQESGLRGDAVSSAMAIGFWQFKEPAGREVGLAITKDVDERKHIYRASIGAAKYFYTNYVRYENWLYAVISYYTGGTGAMPYINTDYIGVNAMVIDENLHWYAQKAIAHKLVYEKLIGKEKPVVWLEPKAVEREQTITQLAKREGLTPSEIKSYNLWILNPSRIPADLPLSYYVPQKNKSFVYIQDPHRELYNIDPVLAFKKPAKAPQSTALASNQVSSNTKVAPNTPQSVKHTPKHPTPHQHKSHPSLTQPESDFVDIPLEKDPLYGVQFALLSPKNQLLDLANTYNIKPRKLARWNEIEPELTPDVPRIVLLVKPSKALFHIAGKYETLTEVAFTYNRKVEKLKKLNRIKDEHQLLHPGQKIYLKEAKPPKEKIVRYVISTPELPIPSKADGISPVSPAPNQNEPLTIQSAQVLQSEMPSINEDATHVVQKGETLWALAKKYNTTVETLRKLNGLDEGQSLSAGQIIKVKHSTETTAISE